MASGYHAFARPRPRRAGWLRRVRLLERENDVLSPALPYSAGIPSRGRVRRRLIMPLVRWVYFLYAHTRPKWQKYRRSGAAQRHISAWGGRKKRERLCSKRIGKVYQET